MNMNEELQFLRFFYDEMKKMLSDAGTDEVFWITDSYESKTGNSVPGKYDEC